jgi:L,D-transpeptidase ErfK/SrfK
MKPLCHLIAAMMLVLALAARADVARAGATPADSAFKGPAASADTSRLAAPADTAKAPADSVKAAPKRPPMPRPPLKKADLSVLAPTGWEPSCIGTTLTELDSVYTVKKGDFLSGVSGMHGVPFRRMVRENRIRDVHRIDKGMRVHVRGRWIVPGRIADGLVLNLAEPKIYWFADSTLVGVYAVGVGVVGWETPPGSYYVANRRADPIWYVPPSIQEEMLAEGKEVKTRVEAGPDNPLGRYWLGLNKGGYGIHGTNAPSSVGQFSSHGCMRVHPDNIEKLYKGLPDRARVEVIYEPIKVACFPSRNEVYLEVHSDHYRWVGKRFNRARDLITAAGCAELVDWKLVDRVVRDSEGIATRVSRPVQGAPPDPFAPDTTAASAR